MSYTILKISTILFHFDFVISKICGIIPLRLVKNEAI